MKQKAKVGRTVDVIVDKVDDAGAVGRTKWDAPEIDGTVRLPGATGLKVGDIVKARVTGADDYDLTASIGYKPAGGGYRPGGRR